MVVVVVVVVVAMVVVEGPLTASTGTRRLLSLSGDGQRPGATRR
jgi:hypothetical protein